MEILRSPIQLVGQHAQVAASSLPHHQSISSPVVVQPFSSSPSLPPPIVVSEPPTVKAHHQFPSRRASCSCEPVRPVRVRSPNAWLSPAQSPSASLEARPGLIARARPLFVAQSSAPVQIAPSAQSRS